MSEYKKKKKQVMDKDIKGICDDIKAGRYYTGTVEEHMERVTGAKK